MMSATVALFVFRVSIPSARMWVLGYLLLDD